GREGTPQCLSRHSERQPHEANTGAIEEEGCDRQEPTGSAHRGCGWAASTISEQKTVVDRSRLPPDYGPHHGTKGLTWDRLILKSRTTCWTASSAAWPVTSATSQRAK